MSRKVSIFLCVFSLISFLAFPAVAADNIAVPGGYLQSQFKDLSRQLGLAVSYVPAAPAEPLGLLGFDVGVEVTSVDIDNNATFWSSAISGGAPNFLMFPKLHAQKGLPFGVDVGLVYASVPNSNVKLLGGEVKYALVKGSTVTPAVALRADYTTLNGVSDIDLQTYGADLSVSKGFAFITPYAGIGQVRIKSSEQSPFVALSDEKLTETRGFGGVKIAIIPFSLVAEAGLADVNSYTLRFNLSF